MEILNFSVIRDKDGIFTVTSLNYPKIIAIAQSLDGAVDLLEEQIKKLFLQIHFCDADRYRSCKLYSTATHRIFHD